MIILFRSVRKELNRDPELVVLQLLDPHYTSCYRTVHRTSWLEIARHVDIHLRDIVTRRSRKIESGLRDIESRAIFWRKLWVKGTNPDYLFQICPGCVAALLELTRMTNISKAEAKGTSGRLPRIHPGPRDLSALGGNSVEIRPRVPRVVAAWIPSGCTVFQELACQKQASRIEPISRVTYRRSG
jgi:hypothetical protein